jgi:hypothetical protein
MRDGAAGPGARHPLRAGLRAGIIIIIIIVMLVIIIENCK